MIAKPITSTNLCDFQRFLEAFKDHSESCYEGCAWVRDPSWTEHGQAHVGEYCDRGHTLLERWLRVP